MKPKQLTDTEMLDALRGNDPRSHNAALRQLYDDKAVNAKVRLMVHDYKYKADPDDVLQDGVILLNDMMRDGRFEGRCRISTFLVAVCRNLIRNQARSVERIVLKEEVKESDITDEYLNDPQNEPFKIEELKADLKKRDSLLRGLIAQMKERCREILRLRYFESYNMNQVVEALQLNNAAHAGNVAQDCRQTLHRMIEATPMLKQFFKTNLYPNF
jgi:RNA polymerase sigma factor (sigma-70 family)